MGDLYGFSSNMGGNERLLRNDFFKIDNWLKTLKN